MDFDDDLSDVGPRDSAPESSDVEYACTVCGKEAGPYSGKGRKPTKCGEHKKGTASTSRASNSNSALATQAVDALMQINGFMTLGAMITGFYQTASAITDAEDGFRRQAHAALLTDPALCRSILRGGTKSGKVALVIAYLMMGATIFPTAKAEFVAKRDARAEAKILAGESVE